MTPVASEVPTPMETKMLGQPVGILTLAEKIGMLHQDIEGRNEEMFALLTQAKQAAGPRGWLKWLADNEKTLGFGERQARLYMREPELRSSDLKARAADQKKRRAATKASKEAPTEFNGSHFLLDGVVVPDNENGVEVLPETEQTKVADLPAEEQQCLTREVKVLEESKPKPTAVKVPATSKTDLWEGIIRCETPEERRDVVKVLDQAFEFIHHGDSRLEILNKFVDLDDLEDHLDDLEELLEGPAFEDFPGALTTIEMGATCLTPAHIKALTGWRDRIDAILQKAEVKPEPAVPEAVGEPEPDSVAQP